MNDFRLLAVIVGFVSILVAFPLHYLHIWLMEKIGGGQRIREWGPRLHEHKRGTPTMGGVPLLLSLILALTLYWYLHPDPPLYYLFCFLAALGFGLIGLVDDLLSIFRGKAMGLTVIQKVTLQFLLSVGLCFFAVEVIGLSGAVSIPFVEGLFPLTVWPHCSLIIVVLISTVNSANLTDGLDGLLAGLALIVMGSLAVVGGRQFLPLFAATGGALLVFLWHNFHPAGLFLGDTGAFALGGLIGSVSIVFGVEFYLPFIAGVLFLETLSVLLQIFTYNLTGKRLFKMSPLHHHFEDAEGIDYEYFLPRVIWPERMITVRFWLLQIFLSGIGLILYYGNPFA